MITVRVDSRELPADLVQIKTMADLIELIKATIDPDTIITSLSLSGSPLSDTDWQSPLSLHQEKVLEVTTGDRTNYVRERLESADSYLEHISREFEEAGEGYRGGDTEQGNRSLAAAVDDLLAFLNWYVALLAIEQHQRQSQILELQTRMSAIQNVCEQLIQQQLYNSWWALGETLQSQLHPVLTDLRTYCQSVATDSPSGLAS